MKSLLTTVHSAAAQALLLFLYDVTVGFTLNLEIRI